MTLPAIKVRDLSKVYRLGQLNAGTLREEVARWFGRGHAKPDREEEDFWALRDVSFDVQPGEVLGIVGRNGAGKSTLLKLLSRVTEPTAGEIRVRGRIASLLEVGTGFHPELTGRENIYLNGAILGMTRAEIRSKFDEIVDFSEVEKFLDTPVKRYSSGMYVRLAFAVAAHLEPEILIVDEVLAVGDAQFQKKCLGKIKSVSREGGRTVIFVSHNMAALTSLCDRGLLLEAGRIKMIGSIQDATQDHLLSTSDSGEVRRRVWEEVESAPGDDRLRLHKAILEPSRGPLDRKQPLRLILDYWNMKATDNLLIELVVRAADGSIVFQSFDAEYEGGQLSLRPKGLLRTFCTIPGGVLNSGRYTMDFHFIHGSMTDYTSEHAVFIIDVQDMNPRGGLMYLDAFLGVVHPNIEWKNEILNSESLEYPDPGIIMGKS